MMPVLFAIAAASSAALSILSATDDHPDSRYYAAVLAFLAVICFCFFIASAVVEIINAIEKAHAPEQEQKPVADQKS